MVSAADLKVGAPPSPYVEILTSREMLSEVGFGEVIRS